MYELNVLKIIAFNNNTVMYDFNHFMDNNINKLIKSFACFFKVIWCNIPALLVEEDLTAPPSIISGQYCVEPPTFRKLVEQLPHMKESKEPGGIQTHSSKEQIILSQQL